MSDLCKKHQFGYEPLRLLLSGCPLCLVEKKDELQAENKRLKALLGMAACPNCDGSGAIQHQVSSEQYVTRDMAIDAGDESLEGSLYSDDEWKAEQCQWCYERVEALKE